MQTIQINTTQREQLVDITEQVKAVVKEANIRSGVITVYALGATAAVMIQENWDESVQTDVVNFFAGFINI